MQPLVDQLCMAQSSMPAFDKKWKYAEKMTHDLIDVKVVKVNFNGTAIMEHLTVIVYFLLKPVG